MGIDTTIEKMEETLAKKKAQRAEKDRAKLKKLQDRVDAKKEIVEKIQSEMGNLRTEIEQVKVRIQAEGKVVDAEFPDNGAKPASEGSIKDSDAKTSTKKK